VKGWTAQGMLLVVVPLTWQWRCHDAHLDSFYREDMTEGVVLLCGMRGWAVCLAAWAGCAVRRRSALSRLLPW
jgi:hypothetical protein